jgi:hypothetical protein
LKPAEKEQKVVEIIEKVKVKKVVDVVVFEE